MVFAFNKRRRRRRNAWKGHRRLHARAARKGWRRGHRRRRARNGGVAYNRRRRGRRGRNPGLGGRLGGITAGFDINLLSKGGMIVGGMVLTNMATKKLVDFVPVAFLKTAPGNYISELITAGLLGMAAKKVMPSVAGPIFFGGVLDVVRRIADKYVVPMVGGSLTGIADYLTVSNAKSARNLMGLGEDDLEGLDDYLTVANAKSARNLMGMGVDGEYAVGDELAVSG